MGVDTNFIGIGYEGRSADDLIDELTSLDVEVVVDVRLNPISRKKGLSKTALREALNARGLGYVHMRKLGNPKENRAGFWSPGTVDEAEAHDNFRRLLRSEEAEQALADLIELGQDHPVALLCFEHDESRCHRALILEQVRKAAVQAV